MAFRVAGTLVDNVGPVQKKVVVANSVALVEQDSVKADTSGFAALGTAGALVLGHVMAIVDKNGVGMLTTGVAGAAIGSFAGAYTMAADNQTVAMVSAIVDVSKYTLHSGTPDAAIGTTTGSNLIGYHSDLVDEDEIDESDAKAGTAQYAIWGVDPVASARGVYSIYESQVFGV